MTKIESPGPIGDIPEMLRDGKGEAPTQVQINVALALCDGMKRPAVAEWLKNQGFKIGSSTLYRRNPAGASKKRKLEPRPPESIAPPPKAAKPPKKVKELPAKPKAAAKKKVQKAKDELIAKDVLAMARKLMLPTLSDEELKSNSKLYTRLCNDLGATSVMLLAAIAKSPGGFALLGKETAEMLKAMVAVAKEVKGEAAIVPILNPAAVEPTAPLETELARRLRLAKAAHGTNGNGASAA